MSETPYNLVIIVLAAGKSERFNAIKAIANVQDKGKAKGKGELHSTPLIRYVLQKISASLTAPLSALSISKAHLLVATGGYHKEISAIIEDQACVIICSDAHLGMGHTIAQSVASVVNAKTIHNSKATHRFKKLENASHIMLTLADQIALTSDDYQNLIEHSFAHPDKLVCAKAGEEIMPPAIFPQRYFSQLMTLTGDKGAKALLHQNKAALLEVLLPNAAIDIDTQQDLHDWHNALPQ